MTAPVWLLDFDGVINAISKRGDRNVWDDWEFARIDHPQEAGHSLPLLWSPTVVQVVSDAVDAGVNVVWLSTWREDTRILPTVIDGLPELPWWDEQTLIEAGHRLDPLNVLHQRWKAQVAMAMVPDGAPLLWTDDNLDFGIVRLAERTWLSKRPGGSTTVVPHETIGLSKKNVRVIREWLDDFAS